METETNKSVEIKLSNATRVFSVRCVFEIDRHPKIKMRRAYEERITLWRARTFTEAINKAERDTLNYIGDGTPKKILATQAYNLYDAPDGFVNGWEIFSLIRSSDLPPAKYVRQFFITDCEHSNSVAPPTGTRRASKAVTPSASSSARKARSVR